MHTSTLVERVLLGCRNGVKPGVDSKERLENGKLNMKALEGIDRSRLSLGDRHDLAAVVQKSEAGGQISPDDLRIIAKARAAAGLKTSTDPVESLERALNTVNLLKKGGL